MSGIGGRFVVAESPLMLECVASLRCAEETGPHFPATDV